MSPSLKIFLKHARVCYTNLGGGGGGGGGGARAPPPPPPSSPLSTALILTPFTIIVNSLHVRRASVCGGRSVSKRRLLG